MPVDMAAAVAVEVADTVAAVDLTEAEEADLVEAGLAAVALVGDLPEEVVAEVVAVDRLCPLPFNLGK